MGSTPSSTAANPSQGNPNVQRQNQKQPGKQTSIKPKQAQGSFTSAQRQALLKRYKSCDPSADGKNGIPIDVCLAMPEFVTNKLIGILIHDFANADTGRLHQAEFLQFCLFLSDKTPPREKKNMLFETFNVYGTETFTHDEIFRLYKVLLGHVISDDHILALTFKALHHPNLKTPGEITRYEFIKIIPDSEIDTKLTVQFYIPSS